MENFTLDFVHSENARLHKEFRKKNPKDKDMLSDGHEISVLQETIRGLYVMEKWQREGRNGSPLAMLKFYAMPDEVMNKFVATYLSGVSATENVKTEKRKDKWSAFDEWTTEHQGEQFTTEQLVEVAGFSYQTVLKYVSESLLFTKVKKGVWEVRFVQERE